jgi:hypothetical protein
MGIPTAILDPERHDRLEWHGDNGFAASEHAPITVE